MHIKSETGNTPQYLIFPFCATMETRLVLSTLSKTSTKVNYKSQNMMRINPIVPETIEPICGEAKKKKAEISRKKCQHLTACKSSLPTKRPSHLIFLTTELMLSKKWDHLSQLKTRRAWREPEVCPGSEREKNSCPSIPTPRGHAKETNEVINQSHGPKERRRGGPEAYCEQSWGSQKHCMNENKLAVRRKKLTIQVIVITISPQHMYIPVVFTFSDSQEVVCWKFAIDQTVFIQSASEFLSLFACFKVCIISSKDLEGRNSMLKMVGSVE